MFDFVNCICYSSCRYFNTTFFNFSRFSIQWFRQLSHLWSIYKYVLWFEFQRRNRTHNWSFCRTRSLWYLFGSDEWCRNMKKSTCYTTFFKHDIKPFIYFFLIKLCHLFRRVVKNYIINYAVSYIICALSKSIIIYDSIFEYCLVLL